MSLKKYDSASDEINNLAELCKNNSSVNPVLYQQYDVKRGLRDANGKGVLTGLTTVSDVRQYELVDGEYVPGKGKLFYRGMNVQDIVNGAMKEGRFAFEETVFLLMFGKLPTRDELSEFRKMLHSNYELPRHFVRDVVMNAPPEDMMNSLSRCVLSLYSYDERANDISVENVLRQCIQLTAQLPELAIYCYHAYQDYTHKGPLYIAKPRKSYSIAENMLYMLRPSGIFTELEARVLDSALILHAEHGGGNNSTFTMRVVTSSGSDTYSAFAASLCSLKGPRHGGANLKVSDMMEDIKENVSDWADDEEITAYLRKILDKKAFDHSGLIYGIGHAVYTLSDPRAEIFKGFVSELSSAKGRVKEFELYDKVERIAPILLSEKSSVYKPLSANVDFYSGFAYRMLGLPRQLYTPLFAAARMAGWSAHRLEELINSSKIIRPAYKSVCEEKKYIPIGDRKK